MCAAISVQGVLHHHATLGPYNAGQIIALLDALRAVVQDRLQQPRFVVIWDNVRGKYYGSESTLRLRAKTQKFSGYYVVFAILVKTLSSFALQ